MRVIRLPRHGASCPVGLGVSCSADRQVLAKINKNGVSFFFIFMNNKKRRMKKKEKETSEYFF